LKSAVTFVVRAQHSVSEDIWLQQMHIPIY